ncbi:MAG TPA: hypothetical protein VMM18_03160 [Gemmatimonadaceae bacterium]|nr:hypothetical protein [Gemmatimonadaceae bacterium]
MLRILVALVSLVLTLAPVPAPADCIGERAREVGAVVREGFGEHARTSAPVGMAPAEAGAAAREGSGEIDPAMQPRCEAAPMLARSGGRVSAFTRGFGDAARGDHLPYFPVAPPVLG